MPEPFLLSSEPLLTPGARRQKQHRAKRQSTFTLIQEVLDALAGACERGRAKRVTQGGRIADAELPLDARLQLLREQLDTVNLVSYGRGAPRQRKRKPSQKGRYLRGTRLHPLGGGCTTLYDTHAPENQWEGSGGRWAVACGLHHTVVSCKTLSTAQASLRWPDFCDQCKPGLRAIQQGRG